jgi:hypothetical protein
MYMTDGFTWSDTTCLVFMVSGLVIDSRYKLWFAAAFTFALAICHEWLMSVRRRLVYKCVPCIHIPKLLCATAHANACSK